MNNMALSDVLSQWQKLGWVNAIDVALADFLASKVNVPLSDELHLITVLLSHQLSLGHVCIDIEQLLKEADRFISIKSFHQESDAVRPSALLTGLAVDECIKRISHPDIVGDENHHTPLILHNTRLYLRRYWQYEASICLGIGQMMARAKNVDGTLLSQGLARYFPAHEATIDWQKLACALALKSHFTVITGGPGTGKTTTVVKLLLLMQEMHADSLVIRMAAPTGKAAARLKESISQALLRLSEQLQLPQEVVQQVPVQVQTLHKLLGKHGASRRSRYHKGQPLPLDVLIIDEASMVDIEMMAQVIEALPEHASLILLGDKDQLASVEAGAILAELCRGAALGLANFTATTAAWLSRVTGTTLTAPWLNDQAGLLEQHIVMLQKSHRFSADSGIGQLALAVNKGDAAKTAQLLNQGFADVMLNMGNNLYDKSINQLLLGSAEQAGFTAYLAAVHQPPHVEESLEQWDRWARQVLNAFAEFQVLCATRDGEWGVNQLNERVIQLLQQHQQIEVHPWFIGRPVMVTHNDYQLGLMNGDIGICLQRPVPTEQGLTLQKRVAFLDRDNCVQWVLPSRLHQVETVFAMTVHKSQGSEFSHTVLLLPQYDMPLLSRELIYTGITRAKHRLTLVCPQRAVLDQAIKRRVERSGGIKWQMEK